MTKVALLILAAVVAGARPAEVKTAMWATPRVARIVHQDAVFRTGPTEDHDRRTPLASGSLLWIKGRSGTWLVADLGGGEQGWVEEKDVEWVAGATPPDSILRNVIIRPSGGQTRVDIQLTHRTSFDVLEEVDPPALVIRLHRTTSTVNEIAQYAGDDVAGTATLRQELPGRVVLRIPIARHAQWGWSAAYGISPNMPDDPDGHDFARAAAENLRIAVSGPPRRGAGLSGVTVVVDPGHGGQDPGAVGVNGLLEKDVNLEVSLALRRDLERRGARVVMTRESDREVAAEVARELSERVATAQAARGNLFVSVHHNARARIEDARIAYGVFIYYYQPWSADLARLLMDPVAEAQGQRVRAYVFRSFHVTRQPTMPSVLVEAGFISNPEEERKMRAADYAQRVGKGIADGIERFVDARINTQAPGTARP